VPIYDFKCVDCGLAEPVVAGLSDHTALCSRCDGLMRRLDADVFTPDYETPKKSEEEYAMQFTVKKSDFQKALGSVQGVIDRRGSMPILGNVLIETTDAGLNLTGTDLEVSYRGHCPAEVTEPGAITIPAVRLFALVKGLKDEDLLEAHSTENLNLVIKRGNSRYTLPGINADQFPPFPAFEGELFDMDANTLREMIAKVLYSVSGDDLQYHLASVLLEREEGKPWRLVSTDGHRLTLIDREGAEVSLATSILIPRKGAMEMSKFLADCETAHIGLSGQNIYLGNGRRELTIRLLDKKFPEYQRILPEGFDFSFSFNRRDLIDALERLTILSSERFKGVVVELKEGQAQLTFKSPDSGEGQEVLPVELTNGAPEVLPLEVGFNAQYLLQPLAAMAGETVLLEINSPDRPCRLQDPSDPRYVSIVMPAGL
jgi:DNA polymerase-3 subunit beta